jgi:hypothetical protein
VRTECEHSHVQRRPQSQSETLAARECTSERTARASNARSVKLWSSVQVVADQRDENDARNRTARRARPVGDLADEFERARTPRTPLRALTGVSLAIALTFAVVLAVVALTLYFVTD